MNFSFIISTFDYHEWCACATRRLRGLYPPINAEHEAEQVPRNIFQVFNLA